MNIFQQILQKRSPCILFNRFWYPTLLLWIKTSQGSQVVRGGPKNHWKNVIICKNYFVWGKISCLGFWIGIQKRSFIIYCFKIFDVVVTRRYFCWYCFYLFLYLVAVGIIKPAVHMSNSGNHSFIIIHVFQNYHHFSSLLPLSRITIKSAFFVSSISNVRLGCLHLFNVFWCLWTLKKRSIIM